MGGDEVGTGGVGGGGEKGGGRKGGGGGGRQNGRVQVMNGEVFFEGDGDHRDGNDFPTRRSSDLVGPLSHKYVPPPLAVRVTTSPSSIVTSAPALADRTRHV